MGGHQSPWILCWYMNEIQKNKDTNKISTQKSGDDRACVTISYAISDLYTYECIVPRILSPPFQWGMRICSLRTLNRMRKLLFGRSCCYICWDSLFSFAIYIHTDLKTRIIRRTMKE